MPKETLKEIKLKAEVKNLKAEVKRYQKGYNILMDYFDSIPDEEKTSVHRKLTKINL